MYENKLYFTTQVADFLGSKYDRFNPGMGLLLAAFGDNRQLYTNTYLERSELIKILSKTDESVLEFRQYLEKNKSLMRIVPWIQFHKKPIVQDGKISDKGLENFVKNHLKAPYTDILLLTPPPDQSEKPIVYYLRINETVEVGYPICINNIEMDPKADLRINFLHDKLAKVILNTFQINQI